MWLETHTAFDWEAELPLFRRVRLEFARTQVEDIPAAVQQAVESMKDIAAKLAGKRIAITAGSRGISHIPEILAALIHCIRDCGGRPFVVPAMGSHGGGTAEGQREMLASLGVTEDAIGAPILSSMEVVEVGRLPNGMPVYLDRTAASADATVIVNRVKPHTDFIGDYESGLAKMATYGLGKISGADTLHRYGVEGLHDLMPQAARLVVQKAPVLFGLAIVENAYHEVARLSAVPPEGIAGLQERELLKEAYALMPSFPFDEIDVLIVEEMGKNISGVGMDPKVIGRVRVHGVPDLARCVIRTIVVLNLTRETHGNASGIGLADVTTRHLVEQIDFRATYLNCLTSGITGIQRAFLPVVAPTDRAAVLTALRSCGRHDPRSARIVRIKNTLSLGEMDVSESLLQTTPASDTFIPYGPAFELRFDCDDRLVPFDRALAEV